MVEECPLRTVSFTGQLNAHLRKATDNKISKYPSSILVKAPLLRESRRRHHYNIQGHNQVIANVLQNMR